MQTLSAFRKGVDWAKSGQFTQQDIDEAKLSVFSAVDSPVAPSNKGETPTAMNQLNESCILTAAVWTNYLHSHQIHIIIIIIIIVKLLVKWSLTAQFFCFISL